MPTWLIILILVASSIVVLNMNPYKYSMDLSSFFKEEPKSEPVPDTGIMTRNVSRAAAQEPKQPEYDPYSFMPDFANRMKTSFGAKNKALNLLGGAEEDATEDARMREIQATIKGMSQRGAIEEALKGLSLPEMPQDMPSAGTLGPLEGTQTLPAAPSVFSSPLGPRNMQQPELDLSVDEDVLAAIEDSGDITTTAPELQGVESIIDEIMLGRKGEKDITAETPQDRNERGRGGLMSKKLDGKDVPMPVATYEYKADSLGMIGGVKDDENVWQSFDGKGQAHDAAYKDYSQLFREYTFEKKDGYIPVGEQNGRTVYAAPDYAKDEDGNYISVNKNEAASMAKEMGGIVPTRDMVKNLYSKAVRIPMPTQAIGSEGGTGDSALYTQKVNEAIQSRGVEAGSVIAHGKEFFSDAQPTQAQRTIVTPDLTNIPSTFMRDSADQPLNDTQKENLAYAYNHAVANGLEGDELNAYMAQLAHESAGFRTAEEYASGAAYENRKDLGNTQKGDGKLFKGRGFIQLTGRANYDAAGKALGVDLLADPSKVATDKNLAADVSLWFWKNNVRPRIQDFSDTRRVTKIVNGGYKGLADRKKYYDLYSSLAQSLRPKMRPERTEE